MRLTDATNFDAALRRMHEKLAELDLLVRMAEQRALAAEGLAKGLAARIAALEDEADNERRCVADLAERVAR